MFRSQTVRTYRRVKAQARRPATPPRAEQWRACPVPAGRPASASVASFPTCAARPAPRAPAATVPAKQGCTAACRGRAAQARGSLQLPTYLGDGSSRFKFTKNISTL